MKQLQRYHDWLVGPGVEWGLVGPREIDRMWSRHIDNCLAPVAGTDTVPLDSSVLDVGAGAGLPGIVWAIARPDLRVTLAEPLERRTRFLAAVLADLEVDNATIERGKAESLTGHWDVVTARAVKDLSTLISWTAPLVSEGGRMVFFKGQKASAEIERAEQLHPAWSATVRDFGERARVVVVKRREDG